MISRGTKSFIKKICIVFLFCVQILSSYATERLVLVETFVNDDCIGCATLNALLNRVATDYQGQIVQISYHMWWPDEKDPFYLEAGEEAVVRRDFYSDYVIELPAVIIDGTPFPSDIALHRSEYSNWAMLLDSIKTAPSNFNISLQRSIIGDNVYVTVSILPDGLAGSQTATAYLVVVEKQVTFDEPPGNNGEKVFYGAVRNMLPDPYGQTVTIEQTALELDYEFTLDQRWDSSQVAIVFFLQDADSREILQVATDTPHFIVFSETHQQATDVNTDVTYTIQLRNLEDNPSEYKLGWEEIGPSDWDVVFQVDGVSKSDSSVISVEAASNKEIVLTISPHSVGALKIALSVTALGAAEATITQTFTTLAQTPVLLVDDDGFMDYELYFEPILDEIGVEYGCWERTRNEIPNELIDDAEVIIWWTGLSFPTLDLDDRTLLESYLTNGGNLFISGQDIGYDLCDSSYVFYDSLSGSKEFYETYLKATYESDIADKTSLQGTATDPISGNLTIQIAGSGGANNQYFPSVISPITPPAQKVFTYETNKVGGLCYNSGGSKVVYLSFGFEAITSATARKTILENMLSWCDVITDLPNVASQDHIPTAWVTQNYPNPFNGETAFYFGSIKQVKARIRIYDVMGRTITTLLDQEAPAGEFRVVFNATGLPSGIYFCAVDLGEFRKVFKISYLR